MPQTLVPSDSTASSVDAAAAEFGTLRDGAATTACPPRLRRAVAFMSANQAIARVEDAQTAQDARPEPAPRSSVREPAAAPTLATIGLHSFRARRAEHAAVRQYDGKAVVRATSAFLP
jgi:hypothetical protein